MQGQREGRPVGSNIYRDQPGMQTPRLPASGCFVIAHEKKAYFWLEIPEAADFGVSNQSQGHQGNVGLSAEQKAALS